MATHRSIPAWSIPRTEEPGGLLSLGSLRVGQDRELGGGGRTPAGTQRRHEIQVSSAATPTPVFLLPASVCVWRALGGNAAAWVGVKEPSRAVGGGQGTGRARARRGQGAGRRTSGPARPCVRASLEASTAAVQDTARLLWERARGRHGGFNSCLAPGQALHSEIFRS